MKTQRVYTDTSVIGGCFDPEFEKWSNGLFQDFRLRLFIPVVSSVVAAEVEDAPDVVRKAYDELLALDAEVLLVSDEALDLADAYIERGVLTPNFYDDADSHCAGDTRRRRPPRELELPAHRALREDPCFQCSQPRARL